MNSAILAWWRSDNSTIVGVLAVLCAIPCYFIPGFDQHVATIVQILGALQITPRATPSTPPQYVASISPPRTTPV